MTAPRLAPAQQRSLREDGFVVLRDLVPRDLVNEALRAINASLGRVGMPPDLLPGFRARSFTPELCTAPAITQLFSHSPLGAMAEAALGSGNLRAPNGAQIALRFPTADAGGPAVPHIDGIAAPGNGVPPGTLAHFTALAAVFLNAVPTAGRGNFTVWPGSHLAVAAHFRQHGPAAFLNGFPALALGAPLAIEVAPGDALLAHYALAHGISPNTGPDVRYAVFFRLYHAQHEAFGERALTDPWAEWQGLHP